MISKDASEEFARLAPNGFYVALRVRFAFPATELNALPREWVDLYSRRRFLFDDPALRWSCDHVGAVRWSALTDTDPLEIVRQSRAFGLRYGAVVAFSESDGLRSYGLFYRPDREYGDAELADLAERVAALHVGPGRAGTLTRAELAVLEAVRDGTKLKEIAHAFGVSEGAIKQRLRNARDKLGAANGTQAAVMASRLGLI